MKEYLHETKLTLEKLNYIEKELKLDLSEYKLRIKNLTNEININTVN